MNRVIYLLLAISLTVGGCKKKEEKTEVSISGTVIDKSTGEPIPVVNIKISPGENSTVTGSDGFFQFDNIENGDYTLTASKEGYKDVSVSVTVSGSNVKKDITLQREAAIVNVDRDELDFGSETSVTQLSFSIVNSSREDLAWSITTDCEWIASITPNSGTLQFGKTQPIQVTINRGALTEGNNTTVINVVSSNGRSEITLKAEKIFCGLSVKTYEVTEISATSANLNGEIMWDENNIYKPSEIGFYYSTNSIPTNGGTKVTATVPLDYWDDFETTISGLTNQTTYYVQAFATNKFGTEIGNIVSFVARDFVIFGGLAIQSSDATTSFTWEIADNICNNSRVGGYSDWRLPTINELNIMYANQNSIGGFTKEQYWSSTSCGDNLYQTLWFDYVSIKCEPSSFYGYVRCVRTMP